MMVFSVHYIYSVSGAGGAGVSLIYSIFRVGGGDIVPMTGNVAPRKPTKVLHVTALLGRVFQTRTVLGNMLYM